MFNDEKLKQYKKLMWILRKKFWSCAYLKQIPVLAVSLLNYSNESLTYSIISTIIESSEHIHKKFFKIKLNEFYNKNNWNILSKCFISTNEQSFISLINVSLNIISCKFINTTFYKILTKK